MLKAWTVDEGFMDGPNGFNGLNIKFFGGLLFASLPHRDGVGWAAIR
jgi:hypothetical protein